MEGTVTLALLLVLITLVSLGIWRHVRKFKVLQELGYQHPPLHLFYGNAHQLTHGSMNPVETVTRWKEQYGSVFGYYGGVQPALVITDLDLIHQITVSDFRHFPDRFTFEEFFSLVMESVVGLKGKRWKEVRRVLTPALSQSKLRLIFHAIVSSSVAEFEASLERQLGGATGDIDIYERFIRLSLDIIGQVSLARKINCQRERDNHVLKNLLGIIKFTASPKMVAVGTNIPGVTKVLNAISVFHPLKRSIDEMKHQLERVFRVRQQQQAASKAMVDMLQLMLNASENLQKTAAIEGSERPQPLTELEVIDNCLAILIGGMESTAIALTFTCYLLANHPDVQEKVHQEIVAQVKDVSNATFEDTGNLPYTQQVINESLRLYPPFWMLYRKCIQDYEYKGRVIPKGMKIDIPIYVIHRDPDVWPDPEKFDPDRFSAENRKGIHPAAFVPFGIGPRICLGMRFALMDIKAALVAVLSKYRLEPSDVVQHPPELVVPLITVAPKDGVFVKITPRQCQSTL